MQRWIKSPSGCNVTQGHYSSIIKHRLFKRAEANALFKNHGEWNNGSFGISLQEHAGSTREGGPVTPACLPCAPTARPPAPQAPGRPCTPALSSPRPQEGWPWRQQLRWGWGFWPKLSWSSLRGPQSSNSHWLLWKITHFAQGGKARSLYEK